MESYGIDCVVAQDAAGVLSTAWAIWDLCGGLHLYSADRFMYDGYELWDKEGTQPERIEYLSAVVERLTPIVPGVPLEADVYSMPDSVRDAPSSLYGVRAVMAATLWHVARNNDLMTPDIWQTAHEALATTNEGFLSIFAKQTLEQIDGLGEM